MTCTWTSRPLRQPNRPRSSRIRTVVSSLVATDFNFPRPTGGTRSPTRYEIADTFTKVLGKHTLKAGTDINISHERDYFVYGPKGAYFFLFSLADVPTGNYDFYLQSFGQSTATFTSPPILFSSRIISAQPR